MYATRKHVKVEKSEIRRKKIRYSSSTVGRAKPPNHLFLFVYLYKRTHGWPGTVFNEQLNLWMHFYA